MNQLSLLQLLTRGLEDNLRDLNPWWRNERIAELPEVRRWAFEPICRSLQSGLAAITVLRGPRQVGKSTLQNQIIQSLIDGGVHPKRIFRVQFDDLPQLRRLDEPILELTRWYAQTILGRSLNQTTLDGEKAFLIFDEIQNLTDWAPQLKFLVDINPVRVLVTGSSALRIEAGRDSLAGRISTLEMGPLLLREIGAFRRYGNIEPYMPFNGLGVLKEKNFWLGLREFGERHRDFRQQAFAAFSERGAYPVAHSRPDEPWERLADFLNETVIRRAIQHDLRMGPKGQKRDEGLLEEVFRLACRYIGQSPAQTLYLAEIKSAMNTDVGWQRILAYLRFLDGALLLRLIEPLELRLKKRKGAAKLCICDPMLRAAWLQEKIPLAPAELDANPHLADLAGHVAESEVGYFFRSMIGLDVAYFPERATEPEVDYVLTVGEQRIPVEVKYRQRITYEQTMGLKSFIEKSVYRAPFGIIVTKDEIPATDDPRIVSLPLSTLMLMR